MTTFVKFPLISVSASWGNTSHTIPRVGRCQPPQPQSTLRNQKLHPMWRCPRMSFSKSRIAGSSWQRCKCGSRTVRNLTVLIWNNLISMNFDPRDNGRLFLLEQRTVSPGGIAAVSFCLYDERYLWWDNGGGITTVSFCLHDEHLLVG